MSFNEKYFEEQYSNGKRKFGYIHKDGIREYITKCREKGIEDKIIGYIVGWTEDKIRKFIRETETQVLNKKGGK